MNIVIVGGQTKADFLISMFKKEHHHILVINDDEQYASYLARKHAVKVIVDDPSSSFILKQANIDNYDVLVALCPSDATNLTICLMAKKLCNIQKTVAAVNDPNNVDIFDRLGVDTSISATYLISKYIEKASLLENMTRSIVSEYDSLAITTIVIQANMRISYLQLKDCNFPNDVSVGAIMRGEEVIVPNGRTQIMPGDKVLIITSTENQEKALEYINITR